MQDFHKYSPLVDDLQKSPVPERSENAVSEKAYSTTLLSETFAAEDLIQSYCFTFWVHVIG